MPRLPGKKKTRKIFRSRSDANEQAAVESSLLPSAQPVDSSAMKLEVSCPLSRASQSCHHDHQFRKACAITIGQHFGRHRYQSAQENSAHAFPDLANQKEESFRQGTSPTEIQTSPTPRALMAVGLRGKEPTPQLKAISNSQVICLGNKRNEQQQKERHRLYFTCFPEQCRLSGVAAAACSLAQRPVDLNLWVGTWSSWLTRPGDVQAPHRPAGPKSHRVAAGWGWGSSRLVERTTSERQRLQRTCLRVACHEKRETATPLSLIAFFSSIFLSQSNTGTA